MQRLMKYAYVRRTLRILEMLKAFPEKSAEYLPTIEKNFRRLHKVALDRPRNFTASFQ